jgi:hypothetical protein
MIEDQFAIETPLPMDAVTRRLDTAVRVNRAVRFMRPNLTGLITSHEITLWRDRRNGAGFLYPTLRVTVHPKGSGSVLEGRFVVNSRQAAIVGLWLGACGALSVICLVIALRGNWVSGVLSALVILVALPFISLVASHVWAMVFRGDRDLLFREISDAIHVLVQPDFDSGAYPWPKGTSTDASVPTILKILVVRSIPDLSRRHATLRPFSEVPKKHRAWLFMTPLTIVGDIVTSPFQLLIVLGD